MSCNSCSHIDTSQAAASIADLPSQASNERFGHCEEDVPSHDELSTVFPPTAPPVSISTITSDPRPVFQARLVLVHPHYDERMVTLCVFHRNNNHVC